VPGGFVVSTTERRPPVRHDSGVRSGWTLPDKDSKLQESWSTLGAMNAEPLRVAIVDDDEPIRTLVRTLLDHSPVATVVADADGTPESVAAACEHDPDVVLLDQKLGGRRGTELIGDIVRVCPHAMIAIFSALDAEEEEGSALSAGAFAFYEKRVTTPALAKILAEDYALFRRALAGEDLCAPSAADRRHVLG
jgi:DNA-binding NarL/FixJ family response regulator